MLKPALVAAAIGLLSHATHAEEIAQSATNSATSTEPELAAALAPPEIPNPKGPGFYTGLRVGSYSTTVNGLTFSSPMGLVLGFGTTAIGFEIEANGSDVNFSGVPMSYTTSGLYLSGRTTSKLFFKYRAGFAVQSLSTNGIEGTTFSINSDLGFSASLGGGIRLTEQALLDFDATIVDADVTAFSLGLNYFF